VKIRLDVRRLQTLPFILIGLLAPVVASASSAKELERALDSGRRDGGYVLLAIVDPECSQDVREALAEPGKLGKITRYRHIVARSSENPMLCVRYGARTLPLFVLLDGRGNELARAAGARSPSVIVRALRSLADSATEVERYRARLEKNPNDDEARVRLADHHWKREEFVRAVEHYRALLANSSSDRGVDREFVEQSRERLGSHLVRKRRLKEALAILEAVDQEKTSERHGDWVALHLGLVQYRLADEMNAIDVLQARVESHPNGPLADRILFTLAHIESETGRKLDALEHLNELEQRFPKSRYGRRAARRLSVSASGKKGGI